MKADIFNRAGKHLFEMELSCVPSVGGPVHYTSPDDSSMSIKGVVFQVNNVPDLDNPIVADIYVLPCESVIHCEVD